MPDAAAQPPKTDSREIGIQPGVYMVVNLVSATLMTAEDKTDEAISVKGRALGSCGSDLQQWCFDRLGAGFSIMNTKSKKYLSLKEVGKETNVVVSDFPVAWVIKPSGRGLTGLVKIHWPRSNLLLDLESGKPGDGTPISLRPLRDHFEGCQRWKLLYPQSIGEFANSEGADREPIVEITTVTTTTVTKRFRQKDGQEETETSQSASKAA